MRKKGRKKKENERKKKLSPHPPSISGSATRGDDKTVVDYKEAPT
jgi:hypothetical protein